VSAWSGWIGLLAVAIVGDRMQGIGLGDRECMVGLDWIGLLALAIGGGRMQGMG